MRPRASPPSSIAALLCLFLAAAPLSPALSQEQRQEEERGGARGEAFLRESGPLREALAEIREVVRNFTAWAQSQQLAVAAAATTTDNATDVAAQGGGSESSDPSSRAGVDDVAATLSTYLEAIRLSPLAAELAPEGASRGVDQAPAEWYVPEEWQTRSVELQDAARDLAKAHFCVPPHFKPPTEVPTTFRAPSVSIVMRTPDCVLTNPEDIRGGGRPRLRCEGDGGGDESENDGGGGGGDGGGAPGGYFRVQTRRHPAMFTRKHVSRPEYVGPACKLSACFTAGVFPGARPTSEKEDGYLGDDFTAVLSSRCGNPIERVLARKRWVIPLIG